MKTWPLNTKGHRTFRAARPTLSGFFSFFFFKFRFLQLQKKKNEKKSWMTQQEQNQSCSIIISMALVLFETGKKIATDSPTSFHKRINKNFFRGCIFSNFASQCLLTLIWCHKGHTAYSQVSDHTPRQVLAPPSEITLCLWKVHQTQASFLAEGCTQRAKHAVS